MGETIKQLERIEKLIIAYDFDPNDQPTLPIVIWLMKSWEIGDSMVTLASTRSEHSLFVLSRSLMEYCGRAKYVSLDPVNHSNRIFRSEAKEELKQLGEVDDNNLEEKEVLMRFLEHIGPGKEKHKFQQMLEIIGHGPLYIEFQKLSKYSHGSISQLYKHVITDKEGSRVLTMLLEPNDQDKTLLWYTTAYFLNMGAEALESLKASK